MLSFDIMDWQYLISSYQVNQAQNQKTLYSKRLYYSPSLWILICPDCVIVSLMAVVSANRWLWEITS